MGNYFSRQYGKMRLVDTWMRSDGTVYGSFIALTYRISVNLPMSEVEVF